MSFPAFLLLEMNDRTLPYAFAYIYVHKMWFEKANVRFRSWVD
ncbi:hypothetical protein C1A50_3355 [Paenibacillus polymyxa]|nr:hypothetical protein C1A50_3355 [Paenibacillus polymyxa]